MVHAVREFQTVKCRKRCPQMRQAAQRVESQPLGHVIFALGIETGVLVVLHIVEKIVQVGVSVSQHQRVTPVILAGNILCFHKMPQRVGCVLQVSVGTASIVVSLLTFTSCAVAVEVGGYQSGRIVRCRHHVRFIAQPHVEHQALHLRMFRRADHLRPDGIEHLHGLLRLLVTHSLDIIEPLLHIVRVT
ncbi:MAG: hypothetical protein IKW91_02225 [Bacteroidaceae bacterium]|nr:hypothetical protein [Bacteroidaceae bacterium]